MNKWQQMFDEYFSDKRTINLGTWEEVRTEKILPAIRGKTHVTQKTIYSVFVVNKKTKEKRLHHTVTAISRRQLYLMIGGAQDGEWGLIGDKNYVTFNNGNGRRGGNGRFSAVLVHRSLLK